MDIRTLIFLLVLSLPALAVGIVLWNRERARVRSGSRDPICRRCGYRLHDISAARCSECGIALAGNVIPLWYRGAGGRRSRIWLTAAPFFLLLPLLPALLLGTPAVPAVPGRTIAVGEFWIMPGNWRIGRVSLLLTPPEAEAGISEEALLAMPLRGVELLLFRSDLRGTLLHRVRLDLGLPPGAEPMAFDSSGSDPRTSLAVDTAKEEILARFFPPGLVEDLKQQLGSEMIDRYEIERIEALVAEVLADPSRAAALSPNLPAGAMVSRGTTHAGGTPAIPMRPFYRPWMLAVMGLLYVLVAAFCVVSARKRFRDLWPDAGRGAEQPSAV